MALTDERITVEVTPVARRQSRPAAIWATLGLAFLALQIYIFAAWIISGKATPTPDGPTPIPTYMMVFARAHEVLGVVGAVALVYWYLVRPWRQNGYMTADGYLIFGFLSIFWQDPLLNYTQVHLTVNTAFVNFGSWTTNIPGWIAPGANRFPEPIILTFSGYIWMLFAAAVLGCWLLRKIERRHPEWSQLQLAGALFVIFTLVDLIIEPIYAFFGAWTYPGAVSWLTLFHGKYYQFPLWEAPLWGGMLTVFACIRHFRNDRGETLAERGIAELRATGGKRKWIRFLAISGLLNIAYLGFYNVPIQFFALHADTWPQDIQKRSYLTDGLCGPGTTYACPGPRTPIPRLESRHVSPDGDLLDQPHD